MIKEYCDFCGEQIKRGKDIKDHDMVFKSGKTEVRISLSDIYRPTNEKTKTKRRGRRRRIYGITSRNKVTICLKCFDTMSFSLKKVR